MSSQLIQIKGRWGKRSFCLCTDALITHHSSADGKQAAGRKWKFVEGWQNINLGAHGWAVMHALCRRVLPSCPCYLWAETSPAAHPLALWAPTVTHPSSWSLDHFPRKDWGEGRQRRGLEHRALTPQTAPVSNKVCLPLLRLAFFCLVFFF